MRGGPAATALFTFWDMFWGRIVSHFDNNLVFVILGHESAIFVSHFVNIGIPWCGGV